MVEKCISGGVYHSIYRYLNTWKIMIKIKNLLNNFDWIEDTSHFNEDFIKNYNEESNEGYFLEVDV